MINDKRGRELRNSFRVCPQYGCGLHSSIIQCTIIAQYKSHQNDELHPITAIARIVGTYMRQNGYLVAVQLGCRDTL